MSKNDLLRDRDRLAPAGWQRVPLLTTLVIALASTAGLLAVATLLGRADDQPAFLAEALGSADASAPLVRHPARNVRVTLEHTGIAVARGKQTVRLVPLAKPTEKWQRFDGGVSRSSPLGQETITVGGKRTEHYLTVDRKLGTRTWRWRLDTRLRARAGDDGSVAFLDGPVLTPLHIPRPSIYDADGDDVTPKGAHWELEHRAGDTFLALALDDSELPLPYVVDPAITYDTTTEAAAAAADSNTVTVNRPAGVRQNDVIVVTLSHRLGSTGTVTGVPAAWTLLLTDDNNTTNELDTYWHRVGPVASEPANYSWVLSAATQWVVGSAAFSGIDSIAPVDVQNGTFNNTTTNIVPSAAIAGVDAGSVVIGQYSVAGGVAGTVNWTSGSGWNEIFDHQSANATVANRATAALYYVLQGAAGSSNAHTATCTGCTAGRNIGVQSALKYDATAPANVSLTGVPTTARGTLSMTGVATESESSLDIVFQRSPAGAGTWTTISTVTAAPYVATFDTTTVVDASYDFRVIATNGAGDSTTSPIVTTRIVNGLAAANTLLIGELTGAAFQHYVQGTTTHYYNPLGGAGTFSLESIPQNMPKGITFVGASSNSNRDGSPLHLSNPGVFTGDVLLAAIGVEGGFGNVTPPAGWTAVTSINSGATYGQIIYRRVATAGEPAYYTFTHASAVANLSGGMVAYRGVSAATPVDTSANQANASGTNVVAPTVTTTGGCERLVGLFSSFAPSSMTPPGGMTERFDVVTNEPAWDINVVATDEIRTTPGATGTRTATATAAGVNIGALVALRASECAPGVSFPTPGQTGFTGGGNVDTTDPWFATPYAFDGTNTTQPGAKLVSTVDHANVPVQSTTITFVRDVTAPAGGALTVNGTAATGPGTASDAGGTFSIVRTDYAETQGAAAAGLASSTLTRDSATYSNGVCGTYSGSPVTIPGNPNQTLATGCYRFVLTGLDNVGNTVSLTTDVRVHGAATQITLTGSTANLTSGTTRILTATLRDAAGNVAVTNSSTVVTFAKQSGAGTVTGTGTATVANGVATKTITGVLAGSVVMEATAAGLTTGTLGAFTVVHGAATQIALSGATTNLTSGATRVLTATIQDAAGNTVTADNTTVVTFAKQSGAGTVTGTGTATAASGIATKTITGSLVGSVTMEATAAGLTTGVLGAFTVVHGAATQIALTGSTTNLTSGATRVLTATIQDAAGNTVTADNTTVVTFAKQSGAGTVTGTGTATAASGIATKTITGQLVGSVTMEATAAGLTTGTLGAFTVVHGAAADIVLTGATTNLTSGATRILTATIQDAAGNTVTSDNSTVVAFAKQSGAGTVSGTGTATAAGGVATKTITGVLAGSVVMEATATGLTTGVLGAFTIVHGAATQIALSGATTNLTSGATRVLTATIRDAAGNTVTSDSSTVVTFAKQSGAGTVTGTGTATAASGIATKTITGALVGSVTMEATAAGLTTGVLGAFTVVHGAATQVALTGATTNLTSGATRVLTATIQDAAGNTVTSDNTTVVTFAKQSGAGTVSGTGTATAAGGVATKTITGALVGSVTMEATAAGLTTGTLGAFTIVHGAATQIALTGATTNLTSGATRVLTATIQDAAGNTVTSDSSTVVTFAKQSGAGTVSGTGTATAASGIATKTITGVLVGSVTMEATAAGLTTGVLGAFTVVHGAATQIALSGATTNLTSGATRVLTATIRDAAGNTVTSDSSTVVTFAKQSGAGTVSGTGTATAASGIATKTITGALVGCVTMEATAAGLTTGTLGAFTVVHGAATQISLTGSTANLTSGATRVLTATIQDAAGNTVTADNTTVVTFAKQSGAGTVSGTGTATAASGVATKTITGVLAGSVVMEATAAGLTTGTLGAFTVVHGAATQIALTGATTNLTSGATRVLTATIQDAAGNTVTSDNTTVVTFAKQSGAGTVTGTGTATAASGVATKTITGALVGSVTMEATAAGLTTGVLGAFTVVHGAATQIALTGSTTNLTSGATRVLTATIQDAAGNTVTADSSTVVTFAKQSGAGTVSGTGTATAASGVATKTITGALAGSVTMEATAAGLTTGTLGAFTVVHGAATQVALTGATTNLTSAATRVLTATIQDAAGNTVTADNTTVVTFAKQSGAGTVSGTGTATAASGVATKTITGVLVGSVTMEATAAGLTTSTLGAFTVVHGAAADIVLTGSTANLTSGATRVLTATIHDAAGNTVTSDNSTVVAFTKAAGAGTVSGTGNATAAGGVATKTITGALVGSVTMQATAAGLTTGTLGAFTVVHGAAAQIQLTGSTADLTSGSTRLLTATIQDAAGNTVTSDSSTVVAFAKQSGAGTVTGTGNATAASGVATKTVTGQLAGAVTMEASAAGLTTGTLAFTVVHGAAGYIALSGSTADLMSGGNRVLTATIQDAAGNTVTSDNTTVVAFAKSSGAGTLTGTGNSTASSGVATKTITGVLVGSVTMEATAAGLTTGTLGAFNVVHGAAAQITLTGSTATLPSGATRVLTATIRDAAGNPVTSDNSTVVAFAKSAGAGTILGAGNATASGGVATKTITGVLVGSVTMQATAAGLTTGTLGAFNVVHGGATQIVLSGSTANLTSGASRTLTATLQDAAGNTVTGDNSTVVTFAKQSGAGTVTGTGTMTVVGGVANKAITGQLVGSVTMEATAAGLTTGTLGAFTVVHGAAADIVLTGSTANLTSGTTRILTATIKDAAGNTVTSDNTTVVAFTKAAGTGTVTGTGNATAGGGIATKTITGALAGSVTMEATAAGLTTGTLGAFTVVHGAATQIALTGSTADLTSGANRVLTATIQDAAGNTVSSDNTTVITFAKASGAGTVTGTGTATAASGVASKTITGSLAGPVTMEATAAGLTTGTLGAFTVVHGAATQIALSGATTNLTSGATRVLTATIQDAAGNTVSSDNTTVVTFAKASGAGTVTGTGTATAASGVATKTVTGALVGSVTMEATATGLTTGTLGAFNVVHGAAADIVLTGSTANLTSGATRVLTATIQDAAGNTVTADNSTVVAFTKASGTGTVTGTGNATAAGGVATKTITGALVGSVTMEATATGLTTGTLGAFNVVHGAATQIALTGSTADLTSGANRVLTATIQDAAGNTVTADNTTVITFAKTAGAGTVSGTGTATAASGVATKTITGALAGSVTMEATAAGLTTSTLGAFTIVHGAATQIQLGESGSFASGAAHTLTATIQDAAGNTVTSDNTTVVTFAKTGGTGTVSGLGIATAIGGVATKVVTNAASGQIDLDAQAAGLTNGTSSYTIGAGSASTTTSTLSASPNSIVANGSSTSAITVQLKDAAGNNLTGSGGTVALSLAGPGSLSAVTDNGDGTYSATLTSPITVGSATVSGTLNAAALAATAGVGYVHGAATKIALAESGSNVAGNGHSLVATIQDANGNTVTSDSSTVVAFAKTGGAGTVTGLGTATVTNGVATLGVTNRLVGLINLDAQAAGLTTGTASYTITIGPVSPAASDSTVVAAPTAVYANGVDSATITVTLRDAGGNGVAGKTVTLAQGAGNSAISGGGSTNASGVVTFSVSNASVEMVTYTATDTTDSITLGDDAAVDFTFQDSTPPANTITLGSATRALLAGTTLYYNGAAGGSFALSSAVTDGGGGPAGSAYPAVTQPGWTHAAETVSTPAGGPYVSSGFTFAAGSSGDFTYDVTASDAWAPPNTVVTTLNVTEDSTAPAASILCNAAACSAGWYTGSPVAITLAAPDAGAGLDQIRYTTDGTDPTILTGAVYNSGFGVAGEGVTTIKYRAFDLIGNDTGVQTQTIRIDTIVPDTTIDSSPAAASPDPTPTFTFSSPEAGTTFQVRLNGGSWTSETSPLTLGPLAENTYTFDVRATDVAGNVDATPASFTFTVDATPADTSITSSPASASNSTSASFSFTATDAGPGFECRLDGGAFADCSSPAPYTGLSEASHTFEVRAEDAAGNVDPTPASYTWTVDLTAPNTSFLSTPSDPSANTTPTFGLGSTESPSTFECDLDGGGWASCAAPYTTPALGDGSHTLKLRATDAAGNQDATEASYTWLVDATAPTGSMIAPANGAAVSGTIVLAGNSADSGGSGVATVVFQLSPAGAGTWTTQAASWDTTAQGDGDYDLRVVTTDSAGNSFTSAAITVTVDNTDPTLSVGVPNPVNSATPDPAPITAIANDPGTGVTSVNFEQCSETSTTCTSDTWTPLGLDTTSPYGVSWPIPSDGMRLIRVRATDGAGRQATELVLVTVDRTQPTGNLTAPAAGANVRGAAVALAATATDPAPGTVNTVTFQSSPTGAGAWTDVDTDSSAPFTASFDTTGLADGLYDLRVFTTDTAGNAEAAPATIQVRVDNTNPTGSITSPAATDVRGTIALTSNSADSGSGVDTVVFQRSPAGAGTWTNQAASFNTTLVADGQYDLRVVTTDNAGNTFTSTTVTIRVDNTNPTGSITSPAATDVRGTIALTSNSADSGSGVDTVVFQRSPAGAGTWTNQAASFNTTLVADGQYDLRVVTTDNAGNTFTSTTVTIRVDNTLPTGALTAPADGAEIGVPPVTLTSNSADGGSGVATVVFERRIAGSGGAWTATSPSWDTASGADAVADGSYELRVTTTDNAGNSFSSAFITVLIDHSAPVTSASLAPGSPSNAPVTVSFSAADGSGSGVGATSYAVDGGTLLQGSAVVISAPGDHSNDGSHVVQFFSTDQVGNIETPKTVTVVIDTTAPSGTAGDPGDYLRGIALLTYSTAAADVSSVQFQFSPAGAGSWSNIGGADIAPPYEASWNTGLVADGPYDLRAVVTDSVGNVATVLLPGLPKTVDNTAPAGAVTAPAAAAIVSGSVDVLATATDGIVPPASGVSAVRFEVKPSGAGAFTVFGTQTSPIAGLTYRQSLATGSLADGPAELQVVVTDVAGNETTSATLTVNVDNVAPTVTLNDPGATVSGTIGLGATTAADTAVVVFERSPAGAGTWTIVGTDLTPLDGFLDVLDTLPLTDGLYDLRARATDFGGNSTTSATRTTRVDNTAPAGAVTAPGTGAIVGGPGVLLAAAGTDIGGSGVVSITFEVKPFGAGSFTAVGSDTTAPYGISWDSTSAPDGIAEIRAVITDAAGNSHTTVLIAVTIDSTGPSVTLVDPGVVASGTMSLSATTGGGAVRVSFGISPAGTGSWTEIASDLAAPFDIPFDTNTVADGLYDLRAVGYDALGNASTPSVRAGIRFDNVAPLLVSSAPADGSVSASANQIVLTASEPVAAPGALLDGVAAPVPTISGSQLTFATGALTEGLHVLSGELEDASGNRTPFRVAVTIESTPQADRPPVEKSASPAGTTMLEAPGQLATLRLPASAWPALHGPKDFLVVRVDPTPPTASLAPRLEAGTGVIEVTARWALAGTDVHEFADVLEVLLPQSASASGVPATSPDGTTWRTLQLLPGTTLPAGQADGFYRDAAGVHVLTRHLSYFAFFGDTQPPTPPRHVAGVIADDGLTLRWIPGTDDSGALGNVVLLVNGEPYATFGPTQFEVKMGAFAAGDTRVFSFLQYDAAGNVSVPSESLRAVPAVVGLGTAAAAARLAGAGFKLGVVKRSVVSGVAPGTVVGPSKLMLATLGSSIDVLASLAAPQTQFGIRIANDKVVKVRVGKLSSIPVRILVTRPASGTATLATPTGRRLYTWHFKVKAGVTIKKLRLPSQVRRPGLYRLIWHARSGSANATKAVRIRFVGPSLEQLRTRPHRVEVVLAVDISRGATTISSSADRVVSHATPERTFALLSSPARNVQVVVVDVDRFGIQFLRDLRIVFPSVRAIALSDRRALRRELERAGAYSIVSRKATRAQLNRALNRASAGLSTR